MQIVPAVTLYIPPVPHLTPANTPGPHTHGNRHASLRSPAVVVLLAFTVGLAAGAALPQIAPAVAPFGTLWVRALSALVVPLVVALLVTGVTSLVDSRAVGRMGVAALGVFLALLAAGSTLVALVTPWLLTLLQVTRTAAATADASAAAIPTPAVADAFPGVWGWIATLIPANPIAAAAAGSLLPLVLFTVAFAIAVGQLAPERRASVVGFFRGVADAMLLLVRWILWLAPAGVFALAYGLGAHTGLGGARVFVAFVLLVAVTCLVFLVALYALATTVGGVSVPRFARAILRAQIVAFGTRSSIASLPVMIEASETTLALPPAISGFLLPLAVSTFKLGATIAILTGSLFLARLYGVSVSATQVASVAASAALLSFSVPGVPGGVLLVMVPVLTGIGVPPEGVGLLFAVDVIPDMIRTLTNVTADMTAAVIVARVAQRSDAQTDEQRADRAAGRCAKRVLDWWRVVRCWGR